jgi:glycine cleavage system aminomethyltransferase T
VTHTNNVPAKRKENLARWPDGEDSMTQSLEQLLAGAGDTVALLRNQQVGPNVYPGVPAEFSNWRDEQRGWAETCVLFNQSYHMAELMVEGPGAFDFLQGLGINTFKGFVPGRAKQFVPVTPYGHVIGDVILFYLAENQFNLVGRAPVLNWLMFHGQGRSDVTLTYDERTAARPDPENRCHYRYQVQGPNSAKVIADATGQPAPELKFFNMCQVEIGGQQVTALRHGMAGQPGYELMGPWAEREAVHAALVEAGSRHGMKLVGGRTYSSNTIESGWIPSPLPGIYTGELLRPYREWLTANHYEAKASVGGSWVPNSVEGYYLTPWDLGYGLFVKFDHEFIGRDALERIATGPHRKKVTIALDDASVSEAIYGQFGKGELRPKYMEFPSAVYSMHPFDRVEKDGHLIGLSTWISYTANEGKMLTLAMVDEAFAAPGTEVELIWGEPDGGTSKPTVEKHRQIAIKGVVAPVPYSEVARTQYAPSWRNQDS